MADSLPILFLQKLCRETLSIELCCSNRAVHVEPSKASQYITPYPRTWFIVETRFEPSFGSFIRSLALRDTFCAASQKLINRRIQVALRSVHP